MRLLEKDIEKVLAFVRNELKGEEYDHFLKLMKDDEEILAEVMFQKRMLNATKLNAVKEAMTEAAAFNKTADQNLTSNQESTARQISRDPSSMMHKSIISKFVIITSIAACILLVCYIGLRLHVNKSYEENINLSSQKFIQQSIPGNVVDLKLVSGRSNYNLLKYEKAKEAYKQEQWSKSLSLIDQIKKPNNFDDNQIPLFKSILYIKMEDYQNCITTLKNIDFANTESACKANNYLAYAYIKSNQKIKARSQLNIMTNKSCHSGNPFIIQLRKYFL